MEKEGDQDHNDIKEVLQINLRSLKKMERPVFKNTIKSQQ
jgi:hypothetical protein